MLEDTYGWGTTCGSFFRENIGCLVAPVVEKDMTKIFVVVGSGRSVNEDPAKDAIPGLNGKVSVVPGRSVLQGLPAVCLSVARRDGTLRDRRHTVHLLRD